MAAAANMQSSKKQLLLLVFWCFGRPTVVCLGDLSVSVQVALVHLGGGADDRVHDAPPDVACNQGGSGGGGSGGGSGGVPNGHGGGGGYGDMIRSMGMGVGEVEGEGGGGRQLSHEAVKSRGAHGANGCTADSHGH